MIKTSIASALIATAMISGVAYAQSTPKADAARSDAAVPHKDGWRASKLVGVDVYNEANEKVGDINDVILDKSGKVEHVILGVGGFLGMGEHFVAVSYDKLKWVNEPARTSVSTSDARPATTTDGTARPATADGTRTTTGVATTNRAANDNWYPDHVVVNATKDQLKAMQQFKY
jgi:sporulation protein YlmC with PRC-barrel domain